MTEPTYQPNFGDLPDGALFKFFEGGSLLTKTGPRSYEAAQWGQFGMTTDPAQKVIPAATPKPPHPSIEQGEL